MKIVVAIGLLILSTFGLALLGFSPLGLAMFVIAGLAVLCLVMLFRRNKPATRVE